MCPEKSILSAYFDGEVDLKWSGEILKHIESCEECRLYLDELKQQSEVLQSLPTPDFTDSLQKVKMRIRARNTVSGSTRFWERRITLPVAAAAAAIFATVLSLGVSMGTSGHENSLLAAETDKGPYSSEIVNLPGNKIDELFSMMETSSSDDFSSNSIVELPADVNLIFNGDSQLVRSAGYTGSSSH